MEKLGPLVATYCKSRAEGFGEEVKRRIDELIDTREPQLLAGIVGDFRVINGQRGKLALFKLDDKSGVIEARADEALTNAHRITKPLFVVQGKNDPRVPYTEAEQIVASLADNKVPVWYLRADNEGHGFARKENADFQFYATVQFLRQTLLK